MKLHIAVTELLINAPQSKQPNTSCCRQFSLEALRDITHPAHAFVTTEGIDDVALVELQYDRGGELETYQSSNVITTLVKKNQQPRTRYADIVHGVFKLQRTNNPTPVIVDIHPGDAVIVDDNQDDRSSDQHAQAELKHIACTWLAKQPFVVPIPVVSSVGEAIKKKPTGFLIVGKR